MPTVNLAACPIYNIDSATSATYDPSTGITPTGVPNGAGAFGVADLVLDPALDYAIEFDVEPTDPQLPAWARVSLISRDPNGSTPQYLLPDATGITSARTITFHLGPSTKNESAYWAESMARGLTALYVDLTKVRVRAIRYTATAPSYPASPPMATVNLATVPLWYDSVSTGNKITPPSGTDRYVEITVPGLIVDWTKDYEIRFGVEPAAGMTLPGAIGYASSQLPEGPDTSYYALFDQTPVTATAQTVILRFGPTYSPADQWAAAQQRGETRVDVSIRGMSITSLSWGIYGSVEPPSDPTPDPYTPGADDVPGQIAARTYYDMVRSYMLAYPIKAMLVTADFTFVPEIHEFRSSVFNEVVGAGYTAGGVSVNVNVVFNAGADCVELVAPTVNFGVLTVDNVALMLLYRSTGVAATDRIIAGFTFPPTSRSGSSFTFDWDAASTASPGNGVVGRFDY